MKRKIGLLVILLLILCGMLLAGTNKGYHKDVYSEHYVPVEEVQDELSFSIYKEMDWEQILLQKQEYLTKKAASEILEFLGLKDYIQLPEKSENAALDRGEWNAVYTEILAYLDDEKTVTTQDLLLMDVIESDSGCILVTNEGDYPSKFGQHFLTAWDNYRLYLLDGKCVGIAGISGEEAEVYNTYIKAVEDGTLTFLSGGAEYEITMDASEKDVTEGVADLVFSNGKLQIVRKKEQEIGGKLLSYDENTIEIEGYGRISHTGKIPVYELLEGEDVTESSISKVVLGNMEVSYVIGEEEVCAILIRTPAVIENIRVLLLADDGGKFRSAVYLKADVDASIKFGETVSDYAAGTLLDVSTWFTERDDTFSIQPATENGKIFLCDEAGNTISNGYSGSVEVRRYEEGYTVVNSVPFETYLTAVVPSEMPSTYEKEALKAQAVCARTYAVCQTKHRAQGFDICATTHCQVYQGTAASGANSDAAVDQTAGEFLYYSGRLVQEAVYYSSNGGASEDSLNVWGNDVGYLKGKIDPYEGKIASIIPRYNWSTTFTASELTTLLNNRGYGIGTVKNAYVSAYTDTGNVYSVTFTGTSGSKTVSREACRTLLNLRSQRFTIGGGTGENIYSVNDTGESVALGSMSAIDSSGKNSALSGNVYVITSSGTSQLVQRTTTSSGSGSFVISGSGYGHNVGMSQWGAYSMANLGYSYRDILQFYYTDVSIR